MVSQPLNSGFKGMVPGKTLLNCPILSEDVKNAHTIYGPNIGCLAGKTTRQRPDPVVGNFFHLPPEILSSHKSVWLAADVMYVNKIPFLISVSCNLKFTTVQRIRKRTAAVLLDGLHKIDKIYKQRGFNIETGLMDGEFDSLRSLVDFFTLNVTAAHEHVPKTELMIRVVKERAWAVFLTLPFCKVSA